MPAVRADAASLAADRLAPLLTNEEAWSRLPASASGAGQPLPAWARLLAGELPHTTAALLELDFAQRTKSPLPPYLRAAMRWVAANANKCDYTRAVAEFDLNEAGIDRTTFNGLNHPEFAGWSDPERMALQFALKMTVDSDSVTDEEFAALAAYYGEEQAAAMVLLMAYANFQDRLILCLGATIEQEDGPLAPVDVSFPPEAYQFETSERPPLDDAPLPTPTGSDDVGDDAGWSAVTYEALQQRLQLQREKPTRLRIPEWSELEPNLPPGLFDAPSDIVWYRIVFGYAPELAGPYEVFMRTAGRETAHLHERVFGSSLFWVVTRSVDCAYCMGHCEMNWEVAGLTPDAIAERSRLLAGDDLSSFPLEHQHAFAFARKLSRTPWHR
jgi:alkylhydroperoxidase family enzyme